MFGYVAGNPVNWIDPNGLYGRGVHHDDTRRLAIRTGLKPCAANIVAGANQDVDDNPQTDPWSRRKRELWHFPTVARINEVRNMALQTCDLSNLGRALHVIQDSYSHEGYPAWRGHAPLTSPDDPNSDLVRYNNMLNATRNLLNEFKNKCGPGCCQ